VWRELLEGVREIRAEQEEAGAEDWEVKPDDPLLHDEYEEERESGREALARGWYPVADTLVGDYYVKMDAMLGGSDVDESDGDGGESAESDGWVGDSDGHGDESGSCDSDGAVEKK
jgi:hypothetical protein